MKHQHKSSKPQKPPINVKPPKGTTTLASPKDVANMGTAREMEQQLTKRDQIQFLTLVQGSSKAVSNDEPTGVKSGDYLLGRSKNLGNEVLAVVGISRPRAMLFEDGEVTLESFDPTSEEWAKIRATRKGGNWGLEFLLWLCEEQCFATYHFKNTAREVGNDAIACRDAEEVAVLSSRLVESKENRWHVPVVEACEDPPAFNMPSEEQTREAQAAFESYKLEKKADEPQRPR